MGILVITESVKELLLANQCRSIDEIPRKSLVFVNNKIDHAISSSAPKVSRP